MEGIYIDVRLILKWNIQKEDGTAFTGLIWIWLRVGTSGGCCEIGDELSAFMERREFLD